MVFRPGFYDCVILIVTGPFSFNSLLASQILPQRGCIEEYLLANEPFQDEMNIQHTETGSYSLIFLLHWLPPVSRMINLCCSVFSPTL